MCKKFLQGLFGGGQQPQAAPIVPAIAPPPARPVASLFKNVDPERPVDSPVRKRTSSANPEKRGVPGLGL